MQRIPRILATLLLSLLVAWSTQSFACSFYVATTANGGNDANNGTSSSTPFASLSRAQMAVRSATRSGAIVVCVGQGTYYLPLAPHNATTGSYSGTLLFTSSSDSGSMPAPITWEANPSNPSGSSVIVSGAVPVGASWTHVSGNLWTATLPATLPTSGLPLQPFEYLYYQPTSATTPSRRLRARLQSSVSGSVGYYMSGSQCLSTPSGAPAPNNSYCNLGTFLRIANTVTPTTDPLAGNGSGACPSIANAKSLTTQKCLDRFYYNALDPIATWGNLNSSYDHNKLGNAGPPCTVRTGNTYPQGDVALMQIDAWTVDAMRIACIDTNDHVIFLNATTAYPALSSGTSTDVYNFIGPAAGHRYIIENVKDTFTTAEGDTQNQIFFLDRSGSSLVLYYLAGSNGGVAEAPNSDTVLIPQLPYASQTGSVTNQFPQAGSGTTESSDFVGASLLFAQNLKWVTFSGITFEMDNFVPSSAYTSGSNPGKNWGYNNDINGELSAPQAIDCEGCQNVVFNGVTVGYTSANGILIASSPGNTVAGTAATLDTIENSTFLDIGDSAIRIGHTALGSDTAAGVVNNITINNNLIDGYSRVFPDGEGVAQGNGQIVNIEYNDITDGYHAGISICQLGCDGLPVNGSQITSQFNHLWNMMQGVTSDGGSLYYNVGAGGGAGTGNVIDSNVVNDTSDSSIIDGLQVYAGTGYGGSGIYLDAETGGVTVTNNVVFHMSDVAAHITAGPSLGAHNNLSSNPNKFQNNIFSLAINGMIAEQNPWPGGCPTSAQLPFTTAQFYSNIMNFDLNENTSSGTGFTVVGGCSNSCGQSYYKFQDFEANAYYRANTPASGPAFCSDTNAFHVLADQSITPAGSCPGTYHSTDYQWLQFSSTTTGSWQQGSASMNPTVLMEEDDGQSTYTTTKGGCWTPDHTAPNSGFGTSGQPSDYTLLGGPGGASTIFNYGATNNTINTAGRATGSLPLTPPTINATFPTYKYQSW